MKENFTKVDLENLMVVEQRNGWRGVVIDDRIYSWDSKGNDLDSYNDDLTDTAQCLFGWPIFDADEAYDIVKVYEAKGKFVAGRATMEEIADFLRDGDTSNFELIWERKEKKEIKLTKKERAFLNSILLLSDYYKYIARDKDGELGLYMSKPVKGSLFNSYWVYEDRIMYTSNYKDITANTKGMFEFITWEDEEAYSIEELLKL